MWSTLKERVVARWRQVPVPWRPVVRVLALAACVAGWFGIVALVGEPVPDPARLRERLVAIAEAEMDGDFMRGIDEMKALDRGDAYRVVVTAALADADPTVRYGAALAAGPLGWARSPEYLALVRDADDRIAATAIGWVRHNGPLGDEAVSALLEAALALSREPVADANPWRDPLMGALWGLRDELGPRHSAYAGLVDRILDPDAPLRERLLLAAALHTVSPTDADRILGAVVDGDPLTAQIAIGMMPRLPRTSPAALEALAVAIRHQPAPAKRAPGAPWQPPDDPVLRQIHHAGKGLLTHPIGDPRRVAFDLSGRGVAVAPALRDQLIAVQDDQDARRRYMNALTATGILRSDVTPELLALRNHEDANIAGGVRRLVDLSGYRDE